MTRQYILSTASVSLLLILIFKVHAEEITLGDYTWSAYSESNMPTDLLVAPHKKQQSLVLDSKEHAIAIMDGVRADNFRIELDVAGEVMSGIGFHVADVQNYQFIYFRPGYGGTQEAIQYIPIYNGALSWVIYNYPLYEKVADIEKLEWFHVALQVSGNNMKVYVNNSEQPQMDVELLQAGTRSGSILLRSMFGTSWFKNIKYEALPAVATSARKNGSRPTPYLTAWKLSGKVFTHFPLSETEILSVGDWLNINDPADNHVNVSRYYDHPKGVAVGQHIFRAEEAGNYELSFDFAGKLQVNVNGTNIFLYEKYKLDRIFDGTFRIKLALNKGNNIITFVTEGDSFFFSPPYASMGRIQHQNWGFIAKMGKIQ